MQYRHFILFLFLACCARPQAQTSAPPDLLLDFVDGTLVFQASDACMHDSCNAGLAQLKDAIMHITVRRADKKSVNNYLPVQVGNTRFYLTIYNYPFSGSGVPDTILRIETDSVIIHDVGADGVITDSAREYCINKRTQQRLNWQDNYRLLVQKGICPIACFMQQLHARGYKGYIVQVLNNGHASILYY